MRAPRVKAGDALTGGLWNALADAVNGPVRAPRDLDGEAPATEGDADVVADVVGVEISRVSSVERVTSTTDPDDSADVSRPQSILFRLSDGTTFELRLGA